jgi:short-subunit dehydrogenase
MVARRRRALDFAGRTVVITGGSRGLGLEMARLFAAENARLVLLARDKTELDRAAKELQAASAQVLPIPCDLRDAEAIASTVNEIRGWSGTIDVLINNAGVIQVGPFETMNAADFQEALAVHLWGALELTRQILPLMTRNGRIINIASIGGKVAVPHLLPYCVSKFALVGLSDGLRAELSRRQIRVTTVCPGLMRTGSHIQARFKGQHKKEFALFALANGLPLFSTGSRHAAQRIVEACRYGDASLLITPQARALHLANALMPNLTADLMSWTARLLPDSHGASTEAKTGRQSRSALAPPISHAAGGRRQCAQQRELITLLALKYYSR